MEKLKQIRYADDDVVSISSLLRLRLPSLLLGLFLGIFLSIIVSRFEETLSKDIRIAFFIPFVIYMAAAVGAQTQNIYARDLKSGKASFRKYLLKESVLGVFFGAISSGVTASITYLWFGSIQLTLAVSLAMFLTVAIAPLVALLVTELLQLEHTDPAVGAGPLATVIQDTLSVLIYGLITSALIL